MVGNCTLLLYLHEADIFKALTNAGNKKNYLHDLPCVGFLNLLEKNILKLRMELVVIHI